MDTRRQASETVSPRVAVSVSRPMATLRRTQNVLNGFWQTSDLAYRYMLIRTAADFPDQSRRTVDVLGNIESQVWYPSSQGRIKREASLEATLQQVRDNAVHVFRATLVSFASAFELYLDERVAPLRRQRRWGPYVLSLATPPLIEAEIPVRLHTLLCADLCRLIRNKIVHEAFSELASLGSQEQSEWERKLREHACDGGWPPRTVENAIRYATNHVIGGAERKVEAARRHGKEIPIEYFYMLFNFTNLDSLAFEIEEALQATGDRSGDPVTRKAEAVRRTDLILDAMSPAN